MFNISVEWALCGNITEDDIHPKGLIQVKEVAEIQNVNWYISSTINMISLSYYGQVD